MRCETRVQLGHRKTVFDWNVGGGWGRAKSRPGFEFSWGTARPCSIGTTSRDAPAEAQAIVPFAMPQPPTGTKRRGGWGRAESGWGLEVGWGTARPCSIGTIFRDAPAEAEAIVPFAMPQPRTQNRTRAYRLCAFVMPDRMAVRRVFEHDPICRVEGTGNVHRRHGEPAGC
jgi:hypothetical protein